MKKVYSYLLTSNWNTEEHSDPIKFSNDKDAWNYLAKKLDARYKTGGQVCVILYKIDTIQFIHPQHGNPNKYGGNDNLSNDLLEIRIPVLAGYKEYDYDGNPWNNPTYCNLCEDKIAPKKFRESGYCKDCEKVMVSLCEWSEHKKRIKSNISTFQLAVLKKKGNRGDDAEFLIRDGTLVLEG